MTPQTMKMLVMFILAAALLNVTNYLFYCLYNPQSRQAMRVEVQVSEHTKFVRFMTKRRMTRIPKWSNFLLCDNKSSTNPTNNKVSASSEEDYRDQGSDSVFYYNGIKKGEFLCPETPLGLGPLKANQFVSPQEIEKLYDVLQPGGLYEENECVPRQNVAVIVTHREQNQLLEFLYSLHCFLMKQQLGYQIFVVRQSKYQSHEKIIM
ncbi:uncharacterized protein LOC114357886 [Ostrinia furnacalis]|uniref:uncharacterized protein LOC114357886 n=1 Tax=Ostrinia furnacalis TaxID=93504 RepID=UPI0010407B75|nr:uncharacterized protein LOC114357886 [Ostrinia furnacalis]